MPCQHATSEGTPNKWGDPKQAHLLEGTPVSPTPRWQACSTSKVLGDLRLILKAAISSFCPFSLLLKVGEGRRPCPGSATEAEPFFCNFFFLWGHLLFLSSPRILWSSPLKYSFRGKLKSLSRVRLVATPWTAAYQAPPSMGFSRQEHWSGVPLP